MVEEGEAKIEMESRSLLLLEVCCCCEISAFCTASIHADNLESLHAQQCFPNSSSLYRVLLRKVFRSNQSLCREHAGSALPLNPDDHLSEE